MRFHMNSDNNGSGKHICVYSSSSDMVAPEYFAVARPGGFGTLEEMFEIITLKQLQRHNKAIVFLNAAGYYGPLAAALEHMYEAQFAKPAYRQMYSIAPDVKTAIEHVESYRPAELPSKWYVTKNG